MSIRSLPRLALLACLIVSAMPSDAVRALNFGVTITEIHYHPRLDPEAGEGIAGPNLEFVEIYNQDPSPFDLSGYHFSMGIAYEFPSGTLLKGRSYLVVAADVEAFREAYPGVHAVGNFTGRLDNGGERLTLANHAGVPAVSFRYNDAGRWPHAADGTGHTLALRGLYDDVTESESWTFSEQPGGTPGRANFGGAADTLELDVLPEHSSWRFHRGRSSPTSPFDDWRDLDHDDDDWETGESGFGYGLTGSPAANLIATPITGMRGQYLSLFLRKRFPRPSLDGLDSGQLFLAINFDDGFVAYLNGEEIARSRLGWVGQDIAFDARATGSHDASRTLYYRISADDFEDDNILAVQAHNVLRSDADFAVHPRLISTVKLPVPAIDASLKINEIRIDEDGDGWLELYNASTQVISLARHRISFVRSGEESVELPVDAVIESDGFWSIDLADLPELPEPVQAEGDEDESISVFLWSSSDPEVSDAIRFPVAIADGFSVARFPDGGDRISRATTPTRDAPNHEDVVSGLVIHEIQYHPHQGSADALGDPDVRLEFLELYHAGDSPIELEGYAFTSGVRFTFGAGTSISPGDFLVVAADPEALERAHGISGVLGPWSGALADAGERVTLEDPLGRVVDTVRYFDDGDWSKWCDGGGSSLELRDALQENDVAGAWGASEESDKGEWTSFSYTGTAGGGESELHLILQHRGTILIDDLRAPRGFQSLIANGSFDTSTEGWIFDGTHVHSRRITDDFFSAPACLELTSSGRGSTRVNKIETDLIPNVNSGESVTIRFRARWVRGSHLLTTRGSAHGFARTQRIPVPTGTGTPGAPNSVATSNQGPVIDRVQQDPIVPLSNETVRITARIRDSDGVSFASLHVRVDGGAGGGTTHELFDDGAHGDARPGDGIFGGTLPGFPHGTKVYYSVRARDRRLRENTYPEGAGGPDSDHPGLLYQVDVPELGTSAHDYRLIIDDANLAELQSRKALSNDLVKGTFVFENEEIHYNVGIRYRGSPWLRPSNPKSFRVRINKDKPFHGARKVNLDRTGRDLRERAAFYTIRQNSGSRVVPYSQQAHVQLRLNGGTVALYEDVQPIDQNYLDYWYPSDSRGDLRKTDLRMDINDGYQIANVYNLALRYVNEDPEQYRYNFVSRTHEDRDDFSELTRFFREMDPAVNTAFRPADIEEIIDAEQWIRVLTVRLLNADWDTFGIGAKNAFMYYAPGEGRWKLFPWDSDNTFQRVDHRLDLNPFYRGLDRMFRHPHYYRMYLRYLDRLTSGPYRVSEIRRYLDATRNAVGANDPSSIYNYISQRIPFARAILPEDAVFAVTHVPSNVINDRFTIEGTAPLATAQVFTEGSFSDARWSAPTRFVQTLRLIPGLNEFQLIAFGDEGEILGTTSIEFDNDTTWNAPQLDSISPVEGPGEGGTWIELDGTDFKFGSEVFFGDTAAAEIHTTVIPGGFRPDRHVYRALTPPGFGTVDVTIRNADGQESTLLSAFTFLRDTPAFRRGDSTRDLVVDLSDAIRILGYLFQGSSLTCLDAGDVNDDSKIDVSDASTLLNYLFLNGTEPPPPFATPGADPTEDNLSCDG